MSKNQTELQPASTGPEMAQDAPETCACTGSPQLQMKHLCKGIDTLLMRTLALVLVLAYLMSLIDGLRTIGITPFAWPFSALGQYQPSLGVEPQVPSIVSGFDHFLFLYNCAFPGASRLGSGIGIIAASFWTLHTTPPACRVQRAGIGMIAGALIGFRLTMMLTSSADLVLAATGIISLGMLAYMLRADSKPGMARLPLVTGGGQ